MVLTFHTGTSSENSSVDPNIFKPFLQLLKPGASREVKMAFINNIEKLMLHIGQERGSSAVTSLIWATYLDFVEDQEYAVRFCFR